MAQIGFFAVYFFILCVNGAFAMGGQIAPQLGFGNATTNFPTSADNPNFFNATDNSNSYTYFVANQTNSTYSGHTGTGSFLDPYIDSAEWFVQGTLNLVKFVTPWYMIDGITTAAGLTGNEIPAGFTDFLALIIGFAFFGYIGYIFLGRTPT